MVLLDVPNPVLVISVVVSRRYAGVLASCDEGNLAVWQA
jgi:hypothetical protein